MSAKLRRTTSKAPVRQKLGCKCVCVCVCGGGVTVEDKLSDMSPGSFNLGVKSGTRTWSMERSCDFPKSSLGFKNVYLKSEVV